MKHHWIKGKKVKTKYGIPGYYYACKICGGHAMPHDYWKEDMIKLANSIKFDEEENEQRMWSKKEILELIKSADQY